MTTKRSYGEACRFAHALDLVGERWALLVVRELLLGPKRFTDLRTGLAKASTNILAERLRDLEANGVVRKRQLPPPAAASVYELTDWGRELEPIVTKLGAWGARAPQPPGSIEIGPDSIVLALRSLFDPEAAGEASRGNYEIRFDEDVFQVLVTPGDGDTAARIEILRGRDAEPDAAIETDPGTFAALVAGQLSVDVALAADDLEIEGSKRSIARFLRLFPMPEPCQGGGSVSAVAASVA